MKPGFKAWANKKTILWDSMVSNKSDYVKWKANELHTDMIISIVNRHLPLDGIFKFKTNL
jgi:hypothetical protein